MRSTLRSVLTVVFLTAVGIAAQATTTDGYWAWQPLNKIKPPAVYDDAWCRTPIDRFVLSRLESAGIAPPPAASKFALIRRASFDLTGLPPRQEDIDAFMQDNETGAWERALDRLLASPHYGERWARHWLDLVRYAETNGFERDSAKPEVWRYRDWVVNSLNSDKPYDRFIVEQLAGDELPNRTAETVAATGMHRLNMWDDEPVDVEQSLADDLDSIVDTTTRAVLGVSIGCARCHDHKGDPIPQEDYFRLTAFFSGVLPYRNPTGGTHIASANILRLMPIRASDEPLAVRFARFTHERETHALAIRALESSVGIASNPPSAGLRAYHSFDGPQGGDLPDNGLIGGAAHFTTAADVIEIERPIANDFTISFFFQSSAPGAGDESNPRWFQGSGLLECEISGIVRDFGISLITNGVIAAGTGAPERFIASPPGFNDGRWHHVALTREQSSGKVALFVDGIQAGTATGNREPLDASPTLFIGRGLPNGAPFNGSIDELRMYDRTLSAQEVLALATRTNPDRAFVESKLAGAESAWQSHLAVLEGMSIPKIDMIKLLSVQERGTTPPDTHVHIRGSVHAKAELVEPAIPGMLADLAPLASITPSVHGDSSGRRLALARWMTHPSNAATLRTIVNRTWHHHFGRGIVLSTSDFGRFGFSPSHPQLLDWLAQALVDRNWSLKSLHKLIMRSACYRASSVPSAEALQRDPENTLLSRFTLRRLDAEELRDAMLVAAGEIALAVGGPSVRPPMPREVLETSSRPNEVWPVTSPQDYRRRSLYISTKRSLLDPMLTVFDLADPDSPCPERFSTTQPTQALTMLNSDFANDRAKAMAHAITTAHPNAPAQQVRAALRRVGGENPTEKSVEQGVLFLTEFQDNHQSNQTEALEAFCLLALNLNAFIYID